MASPFRIFRKYQKSLLVGAGVILMFVFVIGDALVGYLGGPSGGGGEDLRNARAVAVKWDDGSLTNADVDHLVARRQITNTFLERIEYLGAQSALLAGIEPRPLRVRPLRGAETPQQGVEKDVVQTKMFANAARASGMNVSDDAVVQYLRELGRDKVTQDDMRSILEGMNSGGWRVTSDYMIDALREEMLARNYIASHLYSFQTVTPQERWTDWLRANDRVVVEAAAIPVESFVIDVPEPTEKELVAFYDEWKEREAAPDLIGDMEIPSAAPGFRVPRQIDVQYIEANFDKFMSKVEDEITDAEIEKYYNENKEMFVQAADTGLLDEMEESDATGTDDASTESTPPASEAEDAPPAEQPESETPSTTESQPEGEEQATPAEGDQSSREAAGRKNVFRLVAFLQDAESESTDEQPAASDAAASAESAPPATAETPASETTADPAATPAAETAETAETSTSQLPTAESASAAPAAEKPKEYQPLDEVKDVIRRKLASDRVRDELTKRMDEIAGELDAEFNKYFGQRLDADAQKLETPPPPPALADLAPLAEKHGFTAAKTGPMPWLELRNTPVGKSGNTDSAMPLSSVLFGTKDMDLYEPVLTMDIDGNHYLAMKTSDVKGRVPELSEVRDAVVKAYKLQKAAEIALKDAEAQAKKAQESGSSLADFYADKPSIQVVRTDPFSQLTRGDAPDQFGRQPFRLSQPDGIVAPGIDFLRRVFNLKDGEVAAVLNNDHSLAYVVRIAEHLNTQEELRNAYLAEANTWDGLPVVMNEHVQMAQQMLFDDVIKDANLNWERDPDPRPQDEVID